MTLHFENSEEFLAWLNDRVERPEGSCIHCRQRDRTNGLYCSPCWEQMKARAALAALAARAPRRMKGGTARKVARVVGWYGEDWCGILPPRDVA